MYYVDLAYVTKRIQLFPERELWGLMDDTQQKNLVEWAEYTIDNEEYIGAKTDYSSEHAFPRDLIEEAKELHIVDTDDYEGLARSPIQKQIYADDGRIPESIKKAVVQLIVEYFISDDFRDLINLQEQANVTAFDIFTFQKPDWNRNLPKRVWNLVAYLKPLTWQDETISFVRKERA